MRRKPVALLMVLLSWTCMVAADEYAEKLLDNALRYIDPVGKITEPVSGYPLEGWNHDPEKGLFLRSFTQLTAIGEYMEVLANIVAGYADNPYLSRQEALERLTHAVETLVKDQADPRLAAKGLLVNFLGLEGGKRLPPLARDVTLDEFLDEFGEEKGNAIWKTLMEHEWLKPQQQGRLGIVLRGEDYGREHFEGLLEPYADDATRDAIMELLDHRVAMIIYGDNSNLSASVARIIGALLRPQVRDKSEIVKLRQKLEQFLDNQQAGYEYLFDEEEGTFRFGWNATDDRYFGWDGGGGSWKIGHMDYMVSEFRAPTLFVVTRFGMPSSAIGNLGFKLKQYQLKSGEMRYTLAPWSGSAFQALGLSLFMGELDNPAWNTLLKNFVDIELDYAYRNQLPGFLSESYTGEGVEYTGDVGLPALAVTPRPRVTDAASLYTLGVAYNVAPDKVEKFLAVNWPVISTLLTEHGPWEGYNTTQKAAIEFQTTAHTLSLVLGLLGTGAENMSRYLEANGLTEKREALYTPGAAYDFLAEGNEIVAWSPDGSAISSGRTGPALWVKGDQVGETGITISTGDGSLSGGRLKIRYRVDREKTVTITLNRKGASPNEQAKIPTEIFTRFESTGGEEREFEVPLPATPGLEGINELVLLCRGSGKGKSSLDLELTRLEFVPFED